jgi:hypothetical protein
VFAHIIVEIFFMNPIFALILLSLGVIGGVCVKEPVVHAYDEVNKFFAPTPMPKSLDLISLNQEEAKTRKERNDRVARCESALRTNINDEGMFNLGMEKYCKDPYEVNKITGKPIYYFPAYKDTKAMMKSGAKAPAPLSVPPTPKTGVHTLGK